MQVQVAHVRANVAGRRQANLHKHLVRPMHTLALTRNNSKQMSYCPATSVMHSAALVECEALPWRRKVISCNQGIALPPTTAAVSASWG